MEFRRDIEGLRAIAILSILIFHIDPFKLSGGFIGVDIFFVISGFLITQSLLDDVAKNHFSISHFYVKRVRRLLPALLIMLLVIYFVIYFSGLVSEINMYGKSALSSLYYYSNIFFYTQSDYFSPDLKHNPLLHTWSLSVEVQYYILFPLIIIFFLKIKKYSLFFFSLIFVASFLFSQIMVNYDTSASFFLSPSRFWQFFAGSFIAIYGYKFTNQRRYCEYLAMLGSLLIFISLFYLNEMIPYPGIYATLPTLGTALIILGSVENTFIYRVLSSSLFTFIGKISYSIYLWHWPIIVLYILNYNSDITKSDKLFLFVVSIVIGYMSWKIVEQPTRKISLQSKSKFLIFYVVPPVTLMTLLAIVSMVYTDKHSDPKRSYFESYMNYEIDARSGTCFLHSKADDASLFSKEICIKTQKNNNILLIGDSHAAQYYSALKALYPQYNISQITSSGCKPFLHPKGKKRCTTLVEEAFLKTILNENFTYIILSARWKKTDAPQLIRTIRYLQDKVENIIVIGPVIEYSQDLPRLLAKVYEENGQESELIKRARKYEQRYAIDQTIRKVCMDSQTMYISALDKLCPKGECITVHNNVPVQFDGHHLTQTGAEIVLENIFSYD